MTEPGPARSLTRENLRALAQAQGLALSDADLDALLPLVRATRALIEEMSALPLGDAEPASFYRMAADA
jgi:hypothetical protein